MVQQQQNVVLKKIVARELRPHPTAQRLKSPAKVKKIMDAFDLDLFGVLHVVPATLDDGTVVYLIVDGQHRWHALIDLGNGSIRVPVSIHQDALDNEKRACEIFIGLNTRTGIPAYDLYRAEIVAEDPRVLSIEQIIKNHGFRVARSKGDGHVQCCNQLKRVWSIDEGNTLGDVLGIATGAWGCHSDAVEGNLLVGIADLLVQHRNDMDIPSFTKQLSKSPGGAGGMIGNARGLINIHRGMKMRSAMVYTLAVVYNRKRKNGRLTTANVDELLLV